MSKPHNLFRFVFLAILLISISGCALRSVDDGKGQLPSWALNPPSDDRTNIYAVGEGSSLQTARDNALAMIAGKISTNIRAETHLDVKLVNGKESSVVRNDIQTSTEALKLSDYEILKSAQASGTRFVLLALDRENLINTLKANLETLDQTILGRLTAPGGEQPLRRLYTINMMRDDLTEGLQLLSLIEGLDASFNSQVYSERYNGLFKERERLEQTIRLGVVADDDTQGLKNTLIKLFLEQGMQAEPYRSGQSYSGVARLTSSAKRAEIFDEMHVQLGVYLKLVSDNGTSVSQAQLQAGASSLYSFDAAVDGANRLLSQQVEAMGVWAAFNMQ